MHCCQLFSIVQLYTSKSLSEVVPRFAHVHHVFFVVLLAGFPVSILLDFISWHGVTSLKLQKQKQLDTTGLLQLCGSHVVTVLQELSGGEHV